MVDFGLQKINFVKNHHVRVDWFRRHTVAMDKTFKKFFVRAHGLSLRPEDKDALLREMRSFMEENPVTEEPAPEKRPRSTIFRMRFIPLTAAFVLLFSIGTPMYAAESALPGDFLYAVKVSINEQIRSFLSFSPTSKALWEIRRAERRLEEASVLLETGKISTEEGEEILKNLRANMDSVEQHINSVIHSRKASQ